MRDLEKRSLIVFRHGEQWVRRRRTVGAVALVLVQPEEHTEEVTYQDRANGTTAPRQETTGSKPTGPLAFGRTVPRSTADTGEMHESPMEAHRRQRDLRSSTH